MSSETFDEQIETIERIQYLADNHDTYLQWRHLLLAQGVGDSGVRCAH